MLDLAGKTAVISGGAAGIGYALAKAFGQAGMNVVIADIEAPVLASARETLEGMGINVLAVEMDVAKRDDWSRTAHEATERFGKIHMLVNNAGVGGGAGALGGMDETGWRWTIDVNLMGVAYGADTFVPLMKEHGEEAWVINVASMAGMGGVPFAGAYTATKAAVVALSEAWAMELASSGIKVSVLAPAFVKTRIHESHRNRQPEYAMTAPPSAELIETAKATSQLVLNGIDADLLAARVMEALEAGELYIFTHPRYHVATDHRSQAIADAFASAAASPSIGGVEEQPMAMGWIGDKA